MRFTTDEMLNIVLQQSAWDIGCIPGDFLKEEPVLIPFTLGEHAKKYYKKPIACNFISFGNNIVASAGKEYHEFVNEYIHKYEFYHCFEMPNMHWLDEQFQKFNQKVCFMAEYWLPDIDNLKHIPCIYETKILTQNDFKNLYTDDWSNALCSDRKELDVLGVGAYDNGKLIGLAGCSADADQMWQIGVDVLPAYRRKGIAASLVNCLAFEILNRGMIPFYCCAWSNLRSAKTAIKAGFRPSWVEMTVKPIEVVNEMNK